MITAFLFWSVFIVVTLPGRELLPVTIQSFASFAPVDIHPFKGAVQLSSPIFQAEGLATVSSSSCVLFSFFSPQPLRHVLSPEDENV